MYAVIFRAEMSTLDKEYINMAKTLRDIAISEYNCIEFSSASENGVEIAISYWKNESDIKRWKENSSHIVAQKYGKERWYKGYSVEIVEIKKSYKSN